jgi:hypothetical protein
MISDSFFDVVREPGGGKFVGLKATADCTQQRSRGFQDIFIVDF